MKNFLMTRQWNWRASGVMLGLTFIIAIALVKPIGVSTQYVVFDAILWDKVQPELVQTSEHSKSKYFSTNAYLNKNDGQYAKAAANPLNYGLVFVLMMIVGGFIGRSLQQQESPVQNNNQTSIKLDAREPPRYALALFGGFLVLLGARLAGGCTSGHMMSGMMQTALSGYLFTLGAFAAGVPMALLIYRHRSGTQ